MNRAYRFFVYMVLLVYVGLPMLVFGAAHTSSSSSFSTVLAETSNYYSPENLQKLADQNAERVRIGEVPIDIHVPLVIFADPSDDEGEGVTKNLAFIADIADLIRSSFNPMITMSINSFKVLASQDDYAMRALIHKKYHVLTMRIGQLVVLVPRWYQAFYGLNMKTRNLRELSALEMTDDKIWDIWLLSKSVFRNPSVEKRNQEFVEDLKKIFISRHGNQTPVWDICFMGHGLYKKSGYDKDFPHIGGLTRRAFVQALEFFNAGIKTGIVYVDSCFAGGGNTQFVEKMIGQWKKPLNFDLVFASVGEALIGHVALDPVEGIKNPQYCAMLQTFFNDAAQLPWKKRDVLYKTGIKQLMKHQLMSRSIASIPSLAGNEKIAQIRPRYGKRVKFLRDADPSITVLDTKSRPDDVIPGKTDLILVAKSEADTLTLAPRYFADGWRKTETLRKMMVLNKELDVVKAAGDQVGFEKCRDKYQKFEHQIPNFSLLYCVYQLSLEHLLHDEDLIQQLSLIKYPEIILVMHQKRIDQPMKLHIQNLTLMSDNAYAGIHKFFIDSFLSTYLYSTRQINIDQLTGPNDIAVFCKLQKAAKPDRYQASAGIFDTEMPVGERITLTDVVIVISKNQMSVSFSFNGQQHTLAIDFVTDDGLPYKYKIQRLYEYEQHLSES